MTTSSPEPGQPPEGWMIQERREVLGLSRAAMGRKIGSSRVWWRSLERGRRSDGAAFRAPVMTYARACLAVGLTAKEVEGRADQSDLTERQRQRLRMIAGEVRRLHGLAKKLDTQLRSPSEGMTLDEVCDHLDSLRDLCGHETLRQALRRLGWISLPSEMRAS